MKASDSLKASHVHNLFRVGKFNPLTGRCYAGMMREWDDSADQSDTFGLKVEFNVLLALQLAAIITAIGMLVS